MKSYTPLNPKPRKSPPAWYNQAGTVKVREVITDDTEFGPGFYRRAEKAPISYYTHRRGSSWYTVTITNSRIRRVVEDKAQ
jgi:hypothetical protein